MKKMCRMIFGNGNVSDDCPDTLENLLEVYSDHFGHNFPIFALRGTPEEAVVVILKHSLQNNMPYKTDIDPRKALY